jgi:fimbrial chaperone protein
MRAAIACAFTLFAAGAANAGSLRVSPVSLQLIAPAATAMLTLRSEDDRPMPVQLRVFRWTQSDAGDDILTATNDVVASPPFTTLAPGTEYTVRIVRVGGQPVRGEECYRVLVDQLPQPEPPRSGRVRLLLRYSVPVFFTTRDAPGAELRWSLRRHARGYTIAASNAGGQRRRVANLSLRSGAKTIAARRGLVGYVLAGATAIWPLGTTAIPRGAALTLVADGDEGAIHAALAPAR